MGCDVLVMKRTEIGAPPGITSGWLHTQSQLHRKWCMGVADGNLRANNGLE